MAYQPPTWNAPTQYGMGAPQFDFSNPQGVTEAQMWMNQYMADRQGAANRPNIQGPYGSSTWTKDPNTGQYTQTLNPSQNQAMANAQREHQQLAMGAAGQNLSNQAQANFQNQYSLGGMPGMQQFNMQGAPGTNWQGFGGLPGIPGQGDLTGERRRQEEALYGQFARNMEPRFQQQQTELDQQLADRGIPIGSKMYEREKKRLADQQEESRQDAMAQATRFGGEEQERTFGMGLDTRRQLGQERMSDTDYQRMLRGDYQTEQAMGQQYSQQARNQAISDYERQRYAPAQELGMAQQLAGSPIMPQQQGMQPISIPGIDMGNIGLGYGGLAQQYALQQQQMQMQRDLAGGMGGGGGGGGGSSGPENGWFNPLNKAYGGGYGGLANQAYRMY